MIEPDGTLWEGHLQNFSGNTVDTYLLDLPGSRQAFFFFKCYCFLFLFIFFLVELCGLLEKAIATQSSTLAWKVPWTEEPGGLQSMGSLRAGQD